MAITLHGVASSPADGGDQSASVDATVTPPGSMLADDYVVVIVVNRAAAGTSTVGVTGGQTWTSATVQQNGTHNTRIHHCRYNGTWAASPRFDAGGTAAISAVMLVWRGVDTTTALDVAIASSTFVADGANDATIPSFNTNTDGAAAIGVYASGDDNTWAVQTGGWAHVQPGTPQYRNVSGSDLSISVVWKEVPTAGATGAIVNSQQTLGPDNGTYMYLALKPAAGGGGATFALAGTAAGVATMTGAITHAYGLSGTAAGTAGMSGALAHAYALAGLAAGTASMTGDATVSVGGATFALAGTAAATAGATGAVSIAYPLAGQANAVATLAGALSHAYALAGQANGVATVTGNISHAYGLAGQASGTAGLTGGITHAYGLAGIAAAVATMVGDLESGVITLGDAEIEFVQLADGSIDFTIHYTASLDISQPHEATLTQMATQYDLGDSVRPTVTFEVDGEPTNPTTVTLTVIPPDKISVPYLYALGGLTRSTTGVYYRDITLDQVGVWYFRFVGTGTCVAAVEGTVTVVG